MEKASFVYVAQTKVCLMQAHSMLSSQESSERFPRPSVARHRASLYSQRFILQAILKRLQPRKAHITHKVALSTCIPHCAALGAFPTFKRALTSPEFHTVVLVALRQVMPPGTSVALAKTSRMIPQDGSGVSKRNKPDSAA
eukprot:6182409-Pleurochrysis_carterae.AAC.2